MCVCVCEHCGVVGGSGRGGQLLPAETAADCKGIRAYPNSGKDGMIASKGPQARGRRAARRGLCGAGGAGDGYGVDGMLLPQW